jgi:hypothetical protein
MNWMQRRDVTLVAPMVGIRPTYRMAILPFTTDPDARHEVARCLVIWTNALYGIAAWNGNGRFASN